MIPPADQEAHALARVGLAGNPSDGFGGAVLATVVPTLGATVWVTDSDDVVIGGQRWPTVAEVAGPHRGEGALVSAAVERLAAWCDGEAGPLERPAAWPPERGVRVTWSTTVPRSVGLAGSSALVVAALRALAERWSVNLDLHTGARLALEAETDLLQIAAGPQDRVVQWAGRTVLMDFSRPAWVVTEVDAARPIELFVAWTTAAASPSHAVHAPLQARGHHPRVRQAMARLADLARAGAAALAVGDAAALGATLDASFEERAAIVDLHPAHLALVHGARAAGASVNYAGSGGAVVGIADDLERVAAWAHDAGHALRHWTMP